MKYQPEPAVKSKFTEMKVYQEGRYQDRPLSTGRKEALNIDIVENESSKYQLSVLNNSKGWRVKNMCRWIKRNKRINISGLSQNRVSIFYRKIRYLGYKML